MNVDCIDPVVARRDFLQSSQFFSCVIEMLCYVIDIAVPVHNVIELFFFLRLEFVYLNKNIPRSIREVFFSAGRDSVSKRC